MIKLGDKVRDRISGFEGIATARVEYINGCIQFCIKPKMLKDGKVIDGEYFDVDQIEVIGHGLNIPRKDTGGIMPDVPKEKFD